MDPPLARAMWQVLEPIHAVVYFAPETIELYAAAGLKGGWMGYFATRAAAMGPVPAEVVIAAFYNFHPARVRRAIPAAWGFASPDKILEARYAVAGAALERCLDGDISSSVVVNTAKLARETAELCEPQGRPLFGAHAALDWPEEPHLVLWHAATLLREFRGDGHVAALLLEGIDGCEANVLMAVSGAFRAETQRSFRGWSEDDWAAALSRLRERGLLDADGNLTPAGRESRARIEDRTDSLALGPFLALDDDHAARLMSGARQITTRISAHGGVTYPNPIGVPEVRPE